MCPLIYKNSFVYKFYNCEIYINIPYIIHLLRSKNSHLANENSFVMMNAMKRICNRKIFGHIFTPSFSYTKVVFWRDFVVVSVKLKKKYLQTTYVNIYYTLFKQINICKLYTCIHISSKQNAHASFCSHDWQLLKSRMYIFLTRTRWDGNHTLKKYLDLVISHIKISRKRFCKSFLYIILCLTCHRSWCIIFA